MLWDVEWIIGVVIVASNLLHVENSQDPVGAKQKKVCKRLYSDVYDNIDAETSPSEYEVVKLDAHRRCGWQFICQGDSDLNLLPHPCLTVEHSLLNRNWTSLN